MSNPPRNPPTSDPRTDRHERYDGLHSASSHEPSLTPVECPFTATQAYNQLRASQEPLENIVEESPGENLAIPENSSAPPSEPNQPRNLDVLTDLSNLDLQTLLLALVQQSNPRQQRKMYIDLAVVASQIPGGAIHDRELC